MGWNAAEDWMLQRSVGSRAFGVWLVSKVLAHCRWPRQENCGMYWLDDCRGGGPKGAGLANQIAVALCMGL